MQLFQPAAAVVHDGPLTVRQIISLYLSQNAANYAAEAQRERTCVLELFCRDLGHKPLPTCKPADLVFWLNAHPEWVSDWSKLRVIRTVQRPFNWCEKLGVIDRNPFKGISNPTGNRGRPMKPQEFQRLIRNTDAVFRRALIFLKFTGARPQELRELEWDQIDFDQGLIVKAKHKTARTRKDRAPRVLVLHPVALKLLAWIKKRQKPSERFVFLNSRGKPWSKTALDLRLYRLRHRLGIPDDCKLYGTRHSLGTRLAKANVNQATIAGVLGHTSLEMAAYYIHLAGEAGHLRDAVRKAFGGN